jgi:hypothetical protein
MNESRITWVLLILIIACGIFIRFDAATEPMWLDECHTAWTVDAEAVAEVTARAADGNQPPLYFLVVWGITNAIGLSEFSLRLVSLIASSGVLILAPLWARKLTNRWSAAILVAGLVAFDGQFIYYATEARSYAMVQLVGLIQAIFFWRALHRETRTATSFFDIAAWTLFSIALPLIHYTSVWVLIAEGLVLLIACFLRRQVPLKFLVAGFVIGAAIISRWQDVATVFERRSNWSTVSSTGQLWLDVEPWLVHWVLIPMGFAFAAWLLKFIQPGANETPKENQQGLILWIWIGVWALIGPAGIAIADWTGVAPLSLVRYSIVSWIAIAVFASLCLRMFAPSVAWVVAGIVLLSSFFGNWWAAELVETGRLPIFRSEDWVTTVSQLAESDSSEPILQLGDVLEDIDAMTNRDARFQRYLTFPLLGADAIQGGKLDHARISAVPTWNFGLDGNQCRSVHKAKGCWLVVRGELDYALIIPQELEDCCVFETEFKFIPNERMPNSQVHLIRVRLKADSVQ